MKESVILQSPHAVDPLKCLTEEEKEERYRTRLDESYRPYTVIDVLTNVYHRCFEDDLCNYAGEHSFRCCNLHRNAPAGVHQQSDDRAEQREIPALGRNVRL